MSGRSVIKDDSFILKEIDGDKFTSGIIFKLDSKVLQWFRLSLFRLLYIPLELEVKRESVGRIHAFITI